MKRKWKRTVVSTEQTGDIQGITVKAQEGTDQGEWSSQPVLTGAARLKKIRTWLDKHLLDVWTSQNAMC